MPFYEEEVSTILSPLCGNKAPRPTGFTMAFWELYCDLVKNETMGFREFLILDIANKLYLTAYDTHMYMRVCVCLCLCVSQC